MSSSVSDDEKVGYGRPPKASRFKPGQSGNPRGRPKGARNLSTDLREELAEKIHVRESGKELHVSKQRAMIKSLVAAAVRGEIRAASAVVSSVASIFIDAEDDAKPENLSPTDTKILDDFVDRELKRRGKTTKPTINKETKS